MEEDHFVSPIAQGLDGFYNHLGAFVEVGNHYHDAAAAQKIHEVDERLGKIRVGTDHRLFDGVQQPEQLSLARGGRDVILHIFVEHDQTRGVALRVGKITKRRGEKARVIELGHRLRAETHGRAGIEQKQKLRVGLAAIPLEIGALGTGVDVPVDVAEIVAFGVSAVLGELLAKAEIRRAVQPRDKSLDHGLGDKIEAGDTGERRGVEEALQHGKPEWPLMNTDEH